MKTNLSNHKADWPLRDTPQELVIDNSWVYHSVSLGSLTQMLGPSLRLKLAQANDQLQSDENNNSLQEDNNETL